MLSLYAPLLEHKPRVQRGERRVGAACTGRGNLVRLECAGLGTCARVWGKESRVAAACRGVRELLPVVCVVATGAEVGKGTAAQVLSAGLVSIELVVHTRICIHTSGIGARRGGRINTLPAVEVEDIVDTVETVGLSRTGPVARYPNSSIIRGLFFLLPCVQGRRRRDDARRGAARTSSVGIGSPSIRASFAILRRRAYDAEDEAEGGWHKRRRRLEGRSGGRVGDGSACDCMEVRWMRSGGEVAQAVFALEMETMGDRGVGGGEKGRAQGEDGSGSESDEEEREDQEREGEDAPEEGGEGWKNWP
ncbi:hypothetical protein BD779DRAFT_1789243 [Infundibulicybe gibba]|nr:hypothetical protein BD779DRAFT_1789243 [Infundibulicybe gibba]